MVKHAYLASGADRRFQKYTVCGQWVRPRELASRPDEVTCERCLALEQEYEDFDL